MRPTRKQPDPAARARLLADVARNQSERDQGYRERALAIYPHVCARCGREFSGRTLRELTVHHRDHDHSNNPPDGSNWELLCLYCHDHEHQKQIEAQRIGGSTVERHSEPSLGFRPFEALQGLLKPEPEEPDKPGS